MYLEKINNQNEKYKKIEIKYDDLSASHYSFKVYTKHPFLHNYISKEKFMNLIDTANNIIYDAKMKKAKFDKVEINKFTYIILLLSLIFIIIYIILFYYSPRIEKNRAKLKTCGLVFFCLTILMLILLEIYNSLKKVEGDKTLFDFYKDDMINYIGQLNKKYKDRIIFYFNENNKNIICNLKTDINNISDNNNSSEISNDNVNSSSQVNQKSYNESGSSLYSNKDN